MLCFSMFCVSAGSKSNLAKAAGAEVALQRTQEKLHAAVKCTKHSILGPLFTFQSQNVKKLRGTDHFWTFIGREMVEKWHAAVATSTFTSQNVKNTCVSHHF